MLPTQPPNPHHHTMDKMLTACVIVVHSLNKFTSVIRRSGVNNMVRMMGDLVPCLPPLRIHTLRHQAGSPCRRHFSASWRLSEGISGSCWGWFSRISRRLHCSPFHPYLQTGERSSTQRTRDRHCYSTSILESSAMLSV